MPPEDEVRLRHMLDAVATALRFVDGKARPDLDHDEMLVLALTKLVEIIGEAAKQITPETRAQHPGVPWSPAARMRDRLVHHYFDIDLDVLWSTVESDLPGLWEVLPRPGPRSAGPLPGVVDCGDGSEDRDQP